MEDVDDARELVEARMRANGMEEEIFEQIVSLLERFDDDRESVVEEMLDRLEAPGWADLRNRWATNCEQGIALLERLEEDTVDLLEESEATDQSASERMATVGPVDFLSGERKVWAQLAKGDIPDVATLIGKILDTDIEVIKKCDADLREVRDGDKVVEALIQSNLKSITEALKNLAVRYSVTAGPRLLVMLVRDKTTKDVAKETFEAIEELLEVNYEAAKQKRVLKQTVLDNIELLNKAREQLSESWIDQLFSKGEGAVKDLQNAGRTGDYEAADWEQFGKACIAALAKRRDEAKEQSRRIFGELLPTFVQETTRAFAALTDDPETLKRWKEELEETFESIEKVLEHEEDYRAELADGPYAQAAAETLSAVRTWVAGGRKMIEERTEESDEEVKK